MVAVARERQRLPLERGAAEQSEAEGIEDGLFLTQLLQKNQCFNPLSQPLADSSPFQVEPFRLAVAARESFAYESR